MWPPPGTGSFPRRRPPSMERAYLVASPNPAGGMDVRGPFAAERTSSDGAIQIENAFGQLVTVDERLHFPLESFARARCIVTDIETNVAFEVVYARTWATFIEVYVNRRQADL